MTNEGYCVHGRVMGTCSECNRKGNSTESFIGEGPDKRSDHRKNTRVVFPILGDPTEQLLQELVRQLKINNKTLILLGLTIVPDEHAGDCRRLYELGQAIDDESIVV